MFISRTISATMCWAVAVIAILSVAATTTTTTITTTADHANAMIENTSSTSSSIRSSNETPTEISTSTTTGIPKPRCPSTCHGSVMSLFCEHVDTTFSCPEGEFCCIRKPTTPAPTTSEPDIPDCKGFCIPYFLSGLCYRPARLILRTLNCEQETLCCDNTPVPFLPALPDPSENEMRRSRFW